MNTSNSNEQPAGSDPVVIVSAARTPMGSFQGDFATLAAHDLGGAAIRAALGRASEGSKFKPEMVTEEVRERAHALCAELGKTAIEVPDTPGFVVNRLLFPYLFDAVSFMTENDMPAADVDMCMTLGAGVPMGPIALLDFVGLDVAQAIGETIGADVPSRLRDLVAAGALGRKAGRGFYEYD